MKLYKIIITLFIGISFSHSALTQSWINVGPSNFSSGYASYNCIQVDSNGTPYIAYIDTSLGYEIFVKKFDGVSWVNVGNPGFAPSPVYGVSLDLDSAGKPYVAISLDSIYTLQVMQYDGSNWQNVGGTISTGYSYEVTLKVNRQGEPYVAFTNYANNGAANVMKFNGINWVNVGAPDFTTTSVFFLSFTLDLNDIPYVAFNDPGNSYKLSVKKFNGIDWVFVGPNGFSQNDAINISMETDRNGIPYVIYGDAVDGYKARVKKFNGTNWITVGGGAISLQDVVNSYVVFDSQNIPYAHFVNSGAGGKISVYFFNGTSWNPVGLPNFTPMAVEASFAISKNDILYTAFGDWLAGGLSNVMKFDLYDKVDHNNSMHTSFFVAPNPCNSLITISYPYVHERLNKIRIINYLGKTVLEKSMNQVDLAVDISGLLNGIYFINIEDKELKTVKFIKSDF